MTRWTKVVFALVVWFAMTAWFVGRRRTAEVPESSLLLTAERLVNQQSTEAKVIATLGTPMLSNQHPTLGKVLTYMTANLRSEMWHGMKVGGVQIVIIDGKTDRLFPILAGQ